MELISLRALLYLCFCLQATIFQVTLSPAPPELWFPWRVYDFAVIELVTVRKVKFRQSERLEILAPLLNDLLDRWVKGWFHQKCFRGHTLFV